MPALSDKLNRVALALNELNYTDMMELVRAIDTGLSVSLVDSELPNVLAAYGTRYTPPSPPKSELVYRTVDAAKAKS